MSSICKMFAFSSVKLAKFRRDVALEDLGLGMERGRTAPIFGVREFGVSPEVSTAGKSERVFWFVPLEVNGDRAPDHPWDWNWYIG